MGNSNSAPFHGRSKATPHKRRDPSLPPLFGTDARIVIIGGGPAGVHMGHLLKKHGFTNVTILEQADEIGGKSKSLFHAPAGEDVPHEMGTCFMHPGYHRIFALADEYDNGPYFKTGGDNYDKCNIFSPELNKKKGFPEDKPQFILDWMFSDVEESKVPPACFCLPDKIQMLSVYDAIKRYGIIHRSIFGEFDYTLPPRPDDKTLKKITITFGEFLEQHKLQALIPIIILGTSAQGYGLIETLPAFYGLWWNTPELLESLILKKPLTRMFQKGFQNLWKTIAEKDQLNVILNAGVTSIDRSLDDPLTPVRVETTVSGQARTFEADFLIVTSPLKAALGLFKDPTKEEKEIFGALKPASLITTLYKSDVLNQGERATTYYPERLNVAQQGRFYAERNSSRAVWPEREQDPVTRYSVAYQYFDEYQEGREEKCEKEMRQGLEEAGYKNIELIKQLAWEYFPKFSAEHIIKHYPWKLLEMQGTKRTWYAGSSACFESVEDVVSYNHLLLQVFNIEKDPNADKETSLPQKEVGMALLPFFLPKVPRETQEVYFTKDYSITGKCDEADELLRLLTHSRRQTNTVLLKFPVSDVNTDAGILVSEYFSLLLGLNEDPSPEAHAAPPQEAATPAGASTGESQTPEGRPEEGAAEEKPMEIPAPAAKSPAPTGPPAPSPPSPAEGAKIPLSRGVAYSWTNFSRKAKSRGYGAIEFEVNSTLINLGVWYLQLAKELLSCKDKSQKDKAQKEAFRYCNVAAGVFQFVVDKSAEEEGDLSDVRPNVSRALKEISLAEAQTITISRAETANHSANLLASLCRDSSLKYSAAKETLLSPNPTPSPDVEDNLLHYLEAKRELFLAKAHYHHSFHFTQPEAPSPGLSVRCMQDAVEHIKLAQEHYGRFLALAPDARAEEGSSTIARMLSEYERRHSKLAKENDSAFFEKVPEEPVPLPEPRCNSEPVPYVFPPVDKSRWTEAVYASIKANRDAMAEVAKPSAAASCCSVM